MKFELNYTLKSILTSSQRLKLTRAARPGLAAAGSSGSRLAVRHLRVLAQFGGLGDCCRRCQLAGARRHRLRLVRDCFGRRG